MNTEKRPANSKISLIAIHNAPSPQSVPLANGFLKSAAKKSPVEITLVDFFIADTPDECARTVIESMPDAVGFSIYVWNRDLCFKIADKLRILSPALMLFAGGPEITADPESALLEGAFDFIITGEGEIPFTELCCRMAAKLEIKDIPGILMRGNGGMPPATANTSCLDDIPSPYLSGTLDTRNYSGILWQLSRGCVFSCDFCFDSRGRNGLRRFSLERIEAELHHFAQTGVTQVFVLDSTFNHDPKRAKTILRMIRKIASGIHFHFEVRSEFIDREMAGLFAKISCSLQIGLQSSDPGVLKQLGRTFNTEDFCARTSLLNECGAVFGFDLMYGLPGDSLKGFCNSLDFALSLYPNHLDIFPLAVLPGTALHLRAGTIGLEYLSTPPYTLISSPTFSIDHMNKARQITSACDVFFTRGKAVAWFNSVMAVLRLKPSDFFQRFGDMLVNRYGADVCEIDLSDIEVWQLQREFMIQTLNSGRLKRFQPLVLDLVDYHYYYAAALLSPITERSYSRKPGKRILEFPLQRADSLQLARFNYEILDIIETGEPDIPWMSDHLKQIGSSAAIYPRGNTVCTQSFDDSYYQLLESLDGHSSPGELALKIGLAPESSAEFLLFALNEGFVVPVGKVNHR